MNCGVAREKPEKHPVNSVLKAIELVIWRLGRIIKTVLFQKVTVTVF